MELNEFIEMYRDKLEIAEPTRLDGGSYEYKIKILDEDTLKIFIDLFGNVND